MNEIFGRDGLIAQAHPEYEHRPGQIEMAQAVLRAFEGKHHLIVEAGTGTGKTLAYLVPAVASALAGAHYLEAVANTEDGGFKVFHHEPGGETLYYMSWCHGPAGTSRAAILACPQGEPGSSR